MVRKVKRVFEGVVILDIVNLHSAFFFFYYPFDNISLSKVEKKDVLLSGLSNISGWETIIG